MKKIVVVLVVLLSLALAQVGQAADLQADWYANINMVYVFAYDNNQLQLLAEGYFSQTQLGQYGPFQISGGTPIRDYRRYVSVIEDVLGVNQDNSLTLPVSFGMSTSDPIAYIYFSWATNYDPSQMYLSLWHTNNDGIDECLWSQLQEGAQGGEAYVANDSILDGPYYFKVNIVPEPSSVVCVTVAMISAFGVIKRRRA